MRFSRATAGFMLASAFLATAAGMFCAGYYFAMRESGELSGSYVVTAQTAAPTPVIEPKEERLININTASAEELEELNGIGEKLALEIIRYRDGNGAFEHEYEIMNVPGIGDGVYARIKDSITVK